MDDDEPRGDPDGDRDAAIEDERDRRRADAGWRVLTQWDADAARLGQEVWPW